MKQRTRIIAGFFAATLSALVITSVYIAGCGGGGNATVVTPSTDDTSLTKTGQWESTGGPIGGLGYDVRIHPTNKSVMFVTDNYAGIGRSTDGGANWSKSNTGIDLDYGPTSDAVPIFSLTIDPNDPNTVWVGTDASLDMTGAKEFGIYKSTDGGQTWTKKINGISLEAGDKFLTFRGFTIEPGNSNLVYAQAEVNVGEEGMVFDKVKGRVYKTTDSGDNWTEIWEGDNLARYLIIDPQDHNTLYVSTGIFDREAYNSNCNGGVPGGVGVIKSTDGGVTWNQINNGLSGLYVGSLRMDPNNNQVLYAAAGLAECPNAVGGLYKTTDGGANWTEVITDDHMITVRVSSSNSNIVYAGSAGAIYRSTDGGNTFIKYTLPTVAHWGATGYVIGGFPIDMTIDPDDNDTVYINSYGGGVFKSTDGGQTWVTWSKGFTGLIVYDVYVPDYNSSTVYVASRNGPYKSTDYASTWSGIANWTEASSTEDAAITTLPSNSSAVLVGRENVVMAFRSTNGGSSFSKVLDDPDSPNGLCTIAASPANSNIVYAGLCMPPLYPVDFLAEAPTGSSVLYLSTDGGASFTKTSTEMDGVSIVKIIPHSSDSTTAWAATLDGLYKTTNSGANWTRNSALGQKQLIALDIDFSGSTPVIIVGEAYNGVHVSTDGGTSWTGPNNTGFSSGNPYIMTIAIDPESTSTVFAADLYSGIYRSTDGGSTWSAFPDSSMTGLENKSVRDIALSKDVIYVATQGAGVFRYVR